MKKSKQFILPFLIIKPYAAPFLPLIRQLIREHDLKISQIYTINDWIKVAKTIYQKNVQEQGDEFEVGLFGHIHLVNLFFGNRGLLLLFEDRNKKQNRKMVLAAVKRLKADIRRRLPAGEKLEDIFVLMKLEKINLPSKIKRKSHLLFPRGRPVVMITKERLLPLSKVQGIWDFYYFKYVHAADDWNSLREELTLIRKLGVLKSTTKISPREFKIMAQLKILIPPREIKKFLQS